MRHDTQPADKPATGHMASSMPKWARIVKARFGGKTFIDAEAWEEVFRADMPDWTDAELCDVAAWMQSYGQEWEAPQSAKALLIAARTYRKQKRMAERGETVPEAGSSCGVCLDGWLSYIAGETFQGHTDPDDAVMLDMFPCRTSRPMKPGEYPCRTSIPCTCSAGEKWMKVCKEYEKLSGAELDRMSTERQFAHRQQAWIATQWKLVKPMPRMDVEDAVRSIVNGRAW